MNSQWLAGSVRHRRKHPINHEFQYDTGMLALDLAEWDRVTDISPLFSLERFNWLSLKRGDYFQPDAGDLDAAVRHHVEQATGWRPDGPIELVTHPRYFGYVFNPVSFYFCYRAGDRSIDGAVPSVILAQISNTPWHERHVYCLEPQGEGANDHGWHSERFEFSKRFHVSPFNGMEQVYQWTFSFRGPDLRIHMNVLEADKKHFDATLVVRRTPLTRKDLHRSLKRFPLEAFKVTAGIYWHALKLKVKGAPFYTHPDKLPADAATHKRGTRDAGVEVSSASAGNHNNGQTSGRRSGRVSSWRT